MTLASPAALWLLGLAIPIVALHILRSRRTELVVSSTFVWDDHDRPVAAARPWQRLRWSIPLLLQLLAVALLALVLAGPAWDSGRVSAQHLVVVVDTSASMGALDGSPNRLASARDEVVDAAGELGDGARVSIIAAGAPATVLAAEIAPSEVASRLESLQVSDGPFDGEVASSLALGLDRPDRSTAYLLVTDGGLTGAHVSMLPAGTEAITVGDRATNLGVTNVVVRPGGALMHVQASVTNSDPAAITAVVRVDVDGVRAESTSVQVPGRSTVEVGLDVAEGERIAVRLESDDLLVLDDTAWAVGPAARTLRVLRVGAENPFLDALLGGREHVEVVHVPALTDASPYDGYDLAILDGVEVTSPPTVPWLALAAPGGAPGVSVSGSVETPVAALVRHDDDLLAGLDLSELAIAGAQVISAPSATTLVGAEQTPLLVSGRADSAPFVYLGFSLQDSNLGLLPSFPVFADRVLTRLAGADLASGDVQVGEPLPIDLAGAVVVESPSGTRTEVPAGAVPPELDRTGIWTVTSENGTERRVVVNPPPEESHIAPQDGLALRGIAADSDAPGAPVRTSLVPWLLLLALGVVAAEWWFSARRRGVSSRQWTVAQVARGAICVALLVALVAPTFTRRTSEVATVFVLDVSDSTVGARDEAVDAIRAAVEDMPSGAEAGVVVVGTLARVDALVAESLAWSGPRVRVDGSATDLAAGVRIAGAVAPGDHARRVVLISDGRATQGDVDVEVTRLRRAGVRLDVVPLRTASGPDVLVRSVEVPDRARSTDQIPVRVRISATTAQTVTVVLHRDDLEVDRRVVDAPAGDSEVVFQQPAGDPGTRRWTATVAGPANGVPQNDRGRAVTRIEGRAQILLVEGAPGEAAALAQVLAATGAAVERRNPEELPDLAGLSTQDAVVLVDVPASALSGAQVAALATATRELGTGLVTIGGTSSYGAGDYLGSALEELLPVISEVKDPKRRSKVAQVFAVDVSGSMGACHCAEDGIGANERLPGGVAKTDIARDAAVLALDGFHPTDELGVLALSDNHRWLRDLGPVGDGDQARKELDGVRHADESDMESGTDLSPSLQESAERLRASDASLRHIVLFTDGFEDLGTLAKLAAEAAALNDEGITVSVMGTGEGSAPELRAISDAGGGRFYPGRDLRELPNLLLQETKVVSRQLIVEGDFLPEITSAAPVVASLDAAPHVQGYVASTARPTATQHLRVGEERDPLLASWQVGLGRVISWTSDAGARWSTGWVSWDGAPEFWAGVVRSVYREPAGSLAIRFDGAEATITATFDDVVPDGAEVSGVVSLPGGATRRVSLRRVDDRTFQGAFDTGPMGTYGVGVSASVGGEVVASVSGTADLGYSREYSGEPADPDALEAWSLRSDGRGIIPISAVFDSDGLEPGRRTVDLRRWLVLGALVAWPIAVALSRLRFASGPDAVASTRRMGRVGSAVDSVRQSRADRAADRAAARPPTTPSTAPPGSVRPPSAPPPTAPPPGQSDGPTSGSSGSTLDSLLEAKRRRRS